MIANERPRAAAGLYGEPLMSSDHLNKQSLDEQGSSSGIAKHTQGLTVASLEQVV